MPDPVWVIAADVASVDSSPDRVAMIRLDHPDQPPVILEHSGAAIWMSLGRDTPVTTTEVADVVGIPDEAVETFLIQLAELGFVRGA